MSKSAIVDPKGKKIGAPKSEIDSAPLMTSKDLDVTPMGTKILVRAFLQSDVTEAGLILSSTAKKEIVPCVMVIKVGPIVQEHGYIKEGNWVMLRDGFQPPAIKYGNEVFYIIQEMDAVLVYGSKPPYEDVMGSSASIVRDLTQYVKTDKMGALKAKYTEGWEGDGPEGAK